MYGPLMSISLGSKTSVVASSPDVAREILQKHDEAFSGRTVPDAVTALENHDIAVLWISAGDQWRFIRRALNTYLTHPQKLDTLRGLRHKAMEKMIEHVREGRDRAGGDRRVGIHYCSKSNVEHLFLCKCGWVRVCDGFVTRRLKHRESNLSSYGDLLDSLLDYSQENESEFNCKHIKILLVSANENCNYFSWADDDDDDDVTSAIRANSGPRTDSRTEEINDLRRRNDLMDNAIHEHERRLQRMEKILKAMTYVIVFCAFLYFIM
ncbi:hypothetical protein HYC85_007298 [Camellia sinensis]|uniref:Cytochrome P450 n=1 Tax=Camellia sinensis TaxID=4442 RepID=A0A7J7HNM3_CAMSI|nr:hypothetical protein HYC85_007298 [Camellia sinensis]